ncbi:MAG: hypothetical protein J6B65_00960 [Paludibacteraceae bacterium]|nr:hypothetical protein [Paludibacteraceae bacterium]
MRKIFLFLIVCSIFSFELYAQDCKLKGVVRYKHNDYVGYKLDVGAEVYVVSKKGAVKFDMDTWSEYEKLAKGYMEYLKVKEDDEIPPAYRSLFTSWKETDKVRLDSIDGISTFMYLENVKKAIDLTIVDNSGQYELKLPKGDYYVIFVSKNRTRPTVTELLNRVHIEEISLDTPVKLLSYDFDY